MTQYQLSKEISYHQSCGFYESYGIVLIVDGEPQRIIKDISLDREKAEALVRLFNEESLDPVHFSMAVDDFLLDGEL
jgi:hypothetical protein